MNKNFSKINVTRDIKANGIQPNTIKVIFPDFEYDLPLHIALRFKMFQYLLRSDPLIKSITIDKDVKKYTLEQNLNLFENLNENSNLLQDLFDYQITSTTPTITNSIKDLTTDVCLKNLADKNSKNYQSSIQYAALHIEDIYSSLIQSKISPKTIIKIFNSSIRVTNEDRLFDIAYNIIDSIGESVSNILLSIKPEFLSKSSLEIYGNLVKKYDLISSPQIIENLLALSKLHQKPSTLIHRYITQVSNAKINFIPTRPDKGILYTFRDYAKVYSSSGIFETPDYPHPACIINHEDDKMFVSAASPNEFVTIMFTNIKVDVTDYYIKTSHSPMLPTHLSFQCSRDGKTYDTVDEQTVPYMEPKKVYQIHLKEKYEGASAFRWKMNGTNSCGFYIFTFSAVEVFGSVEILSNQIDLFQI